MDKKTKTMITALAQWLNQHEAKLMTAESCTGGLIASQMTAVAGSSSWFECAIVSYSNEAKQHFLGVEQTIIQEHGAVSEATARAMAAGCLANPRVDCALAVTGIAGPTGGTVAKPVGTVCFAWGLKPSVLGLNSDAWLIETAKKRFFGNRNMVQDQSCFFALEGLFGFLTGVAK